MELTSKQKAIKEAWGDKYSNDVIMEGRRCGFKIVDNIEYIVNYQGGDWYCEPHTFETIAFMPKGLRGYLKNNGWIKIESEDDLPKEDNWFYVFRLDNSIVLSKFRKEFNRWEVYEGLPTKGITHYQPIIKPNPLIY